MNLKERINEDITLAMLAKNNIAKEILKYIKGEIQRKEGGLIVMDDTDIEKLMRNQIESLKQTPSDTSNKEIEVLESYLPRLMGEAEIEKHISETISHFQEEISLQVIMKEFSTHFKGKVDMKLVKQLAEKRFVP